MQHCGDDTFGPIVASKDCRWGLDFTLLFEAVCFVIAPCSVFVICALIHVARLYRVRSTWKWDRILKFKLVLVLLLTVSQIVNLVFWRISATYGTKANLAAASMQVLSALIMSGLVLMRHGYTIRPSTILSMFLVASLLFTVVRIRTFVMIGTVSEILIVTIVSTSLMMLLLVAECLVRNSAIGSISEYEMGILANSLMLWLVPTLRLGYGHAIELENLPKILDNFQNHQVASEASQLWKHGMCNALAYERRMLTVEPAKHDRKYALAWTAFRLAQSSLLVQIIPRLCLFGFTMAQPFLIARFITDISNDADNSSYLFIAVFAVVYIGIAISSNWYQILTVRSIVKMRGGLLSLIYDKTLHLSSTDLLDSSAISLITADVEQISTSIEYVQNIWIDILQIGVATYVLSLYISAVSVAGVIVALMSSIAAGQVSKMIGPRQRAWFEAGRERIKATTQALNEIKGIKWSGLESEVLSIVSKLRSNQILAQKRSRRVQVVLIVLGNFPTIGTPFIVFFSFAVASLINSGPPLTLAEAFATLSALSLLIAPVADLVGIMPNLSKSLSCFTTIQEYLVKSPSVQLTRISFKDCKKAGKDGIPLATRDQTDRSVTEIEMEDAQTSSAPSSIYASYQKVCVGPSNSDSSKTILRDLNFSIPVGKLTIISGPTGCGKSVLLRSIFGEMSVLSGELTVRPGSIGYCDQTSWITNATIRDNIIGPRPHDDTWYMRVLMACCLWNELSNLKRGDQTIIGSKAGSLSGGQVARVALARAVYSKSATLILDEPFSSLDSATEEQCFQRLFGPSGLLSDGCTTTILATSGSKWLSHTANAFNIDSDGSLSAIRRDKDWNTKSFTQLEEENHQDRVEHSNASTKSKPDVKNDRSGSSFPPAPANIATSSIVRMKEMTLVPYYIRSMSIPIFSLILVLMLAQVVLIGLQPLWLNLWVNYNIDHPNQSIGYYFGVYFVFAFGGLLLLSLCAYLFFIVLVPLSSQNLHDRILSTTLKAPLNFFEQTRIGTILNHFTQDLILVDMNLPLALLLGLENGMSSIVQLVLVTISTGYVALAIPGIILALYLIQHVYLRTSKQIRLIELAAKAPIYDHLTTTISGISTIRLLSWQDYFTTMNHTFINESQTAYYFMLCIQKWLALVLNLVVAGLAILLTSTIIALRHQVNPGLLGVSLITIVGLGQTLSYFISFWTSLETSLGAISRIKSYTEKTPKLDGPDQLTTALDWPSQADIEFVNFSAGYETKIILHGISCTIPQGQKVKVCGSSGSGKSSLMASLLRLVDFKGGNILIDGQDISKISISSLQRAVFAVPQTLCFVSRTIRDNFLSRVHHHASDEELERILKLVSLWTRICSLPDGLGTMWTPELFSHGQLQLFAFAQALLSQCPIIIIDEISSYLDDETVKTLHRLLSSEFSNRTILMITHDTRAGFDFDRSIQLEAGRIVLDEMT